MELLPCLRTQARANRLANHRLHAAVCRLSAADYLAPRTGFFPSIARTLDHILAVDTYYVAALHREADMVAQRQAVSPTRTPAELAEAQARVDLRLIALLDRIDPTALDEIVELDREEEMQREQFGHVVVHLLGHQMHHRGQVHAMLAGTPVPPPQLDEFLMPSESHLRAQEMAELGWTEQDLFRSS